MKHAYLILAHNEFALLQTLIDCLDDARNDIYVHFDAKLAQLPELHTEKARLTVLSNRIRVYWADISMIEAEYALFESAAENGPYQYYHLLSGVDLPLKSQDYIHAFTDANDGKEFIGFSESSRSLLLELDTRMHYWHIFPHYFRFRHSRRWRYRHYLRAGFLRIQKWLGIRRNRTIEFRRGSQWVSITENMVQYLLSKRDWAMKVYKHTFCPDESLIQTLAWMSPYRENLFNTEDDGTGCMRCIGWHPNTDNKGWTLDDWTAVDYDILAVSPALFARKFNSRDWAFIEKVVSLSQQ